MSPTTMAEKTSTLSNIIIANKTFSFDNIELNLSNCARNHRLQHNIF